MSEREAILVALSVSGWAVAILFGFLWLHAEKWSEIHFQEYRAAVARADEATEKA